MSQFEENLISSIISSFSMTMLSEIGDKTFLIAAILSIKYSRITIFISTFLASICMIFISTFLGFYLHNFINNDIVHYLSCLLFLIYGTQLIYDVLSGNSETIDEEIIEVEDELKKRHISIKTKSTSILIKSKTLFSPIFLQAFSMAFFGEWGDRSQISNIVLSAENNPYVSL